MPDKNRTLRTIHNDEQAAELARQVALKRFEKDPAIQDLFSPLMGEIKGLGYMAASEIAWEIFVLLELNESILPKGQR